VITKIITRWCCWEKKWFNESEEERFNESSLFILNDLSRSSDWWCEDTVNEECMLTEIIMSDILSVNWGVNEKNCCKSEHYSNEIADAHIFKRKINSTRLLSLADLYVSYVFIDIDIFFHNTVINDENLFHFRI